MEQFSSKIKKFLIFLKTELSSLIFILYFRKKLSKLLKKFSQKDFFIYFGKMEHSSSKSKNFLIFLKESFSYISGKGAFSGPSLKSFS